MCFFRVLFKKEIEKLNQFSHSQPRFPKPHLLEKRKSLSDLLHMHSGCPVARVTVLLSCCGSPAWTCKSQAVVQAALKLFLLGLKLPSSVTVATKSFIACNAETDWSLPIYSFTWLMCHYHVLWSPT